MKKIICYLCILTMTFALCACGNSGPADKGSTSATKETVTVQAEPDTTSGDAETAAVETEAETTSEEVETAVVEVLPYTIQANGFYTYGLTPDGTLIASSEPFVDGDNVVKTLTEYTSWTGIRNFSSSSEAVAAVFDDGTVKMCGGLVDEMEYTDFDSVKGWTDVIQVAMGKRHLVALKSDGSVEMAGRMLTGDLEDTKGFVQIEAGVDPMGVKSDGTVVVWDWNWDDSIDDIKGWTGIKSISSSWNHIAALKSDGTVVACGNNEFGQCNVEEWNDIVAVSAGCEFTIGLKSDGTVVFCGSDKEGTIDVSNWTDIEEIDAGFHHCAGLKSDGTVVCSGQNYQGQCNTDGWKLK